ncbi:MAG: hypothetical protein KJ011_05285 [Burkholderiaceae bacterium]|nr:hypothetical protein [Burkholderiaceae bacterium]
MSTTLAGCVDCAHATRYGNCGEPVAAGLAERFGLVRHPEDGRGCPVFTRRPTELEARAARLLAVGAIEPADLELVRVCQHAHAAGDWAKPLGWCEASARDAAAAGEAGAPVSIAATPASSQAARGPEKRASGPISAVSQRIARARAGVTDAVRPASPVSYDDTTR